MNILAALLIHAHAGVLKRLCERCLHAVVMDSPYQFEELSIDYVIKSAEALVIQSRWRSLNAHEASMRDLLIQELKQRSALGSDADRTQADLALIRLAR